jgi:hypothetical protein
MKKNKIARIVTPFLILVFLLSQAPVYAATSPSLGAASTYGILASTYSNTVIGTSITGDVGYTTGPALAPTINGSIHMADSAYTQAGIAQDAALTILNSEVCTYNFAPGAVDLSSNVDYPTGTYPSGVYCVTGAATIGTGGITLTGTGTHIFRSSGALTSVANAVVTISGGASVCTVWWTPIGATTLGADSTFLGTVIDDAGITIGSNVQWTGQALAFNGTISTDADTITVPSCPPSATLTVIKSVVNDNGGTKSVSDFPLLVGTTGVTSGIATLFTPGSYVVSEINSGGYLSSVWGADCDTDGNITLINGDNKTCTITNNDRSSTRGGRNTDTASTTVITPPPTVVIPVVPVVNTVVVPKLPKTGIGPTNTLAAEWYIFFGSVTVAMTYFFMKKKSALSKK